MINEPVKHDHPHLPAASAGPDNAYYLKGCPVVERPAAYAACLFRISEIEAGRESELNRECGPAVRNGSCIAAGLREQEKLHGEAMFYFPRKPPAALTLPYKVAGDFGVRITNLTDPALIPKPKQPVKPLPGTKKAKTGDYADAINAALAEAADEAAETPTATAAQPAPAVTLPHIGEAAKTVTLPHAGPPATTAPLSARPALEPGETPMQYARRLAALRNPPKENP